MARSQLALFEEPSPPAREVNVSSVPQRSPLRYPGGKTWLVPTIRRWLASRPTPREFVEPFAGGAIVSLTVAFEALASHVTMVERDEEVAAVWESVLQDGGEDLAGRILGFELTLPNVLAVLARPPEGRVDLAFRTVVKNRAQRGGILAKGAGLIRRGERGKGLSDRWYPATLARRIREISQVRDRVTFVRGDGLAVMREAAGRDDAVFFVDPPYTAGQGKRAGARLYTHNKVDHGELFRTAAGLRGDFLMTYDYCSDVRRLADSHGLQTALVPMKSMHHARTSELLVGRDLGWL